MPKPIRVTTNKLPRRRFLGSILGFFLAAVLWPPRWAWAKAVAFKLDKAEALKKVKGSALIEIKGHEILLVRDTEKSVRAINPACTHKKCTVEYNQETGFLECPCHESAYDLDGKVLDGPAPKPLATYKSALRGDKVLIKLPDPVTPK